MTIITMTDAGEQVGRHREGPARLLRPRRLPKHISSTTPTVISRLYGPERRDRGDHRGRARRGLHRHRDHVVDQQRHRGDLGDPRARSSPAPPRTSRPAWCRP